MNYHHYPALTRLMLATFRLNGRLLAAGDALVDPLGLTSARWQVLGAIALTPPPATVPRIAQTMGITRQGAQKQINLLLAEGLVAATDNPRHRRSPAFVLTPQGVAIYGRTEHIQAAWVESLGPLFPPEEVETAVRVLERLGNHVALHPPRPVPDESDPPA